MKITKRQLNHIIREALGDRGDLPKKHQYKIGMRGPEDLPMKKSPAPDAQTAREFEKALEQMEAFDADPKDMSDMEEIRDTYYEDMKHGQPSQYLKRLVSSVDTIIREQIPQDAYYWIFPDLLEGAIRRIIREAMGSDADALNRIKNREKMIGRGIDAGTIGYNPDWDYDKKPRNTYKPKSGFGTMKMVKPFFDEFGFEWKGKTSHDATASMKWDNGQSGYFVKIEFDGSIYKMKWLKREKIKKPQRGGPYVKVSPWSETWEVEPTEKAIATAVDEINYEIGEDEAKGFE